MHLSGVSLPAVLPATQHTLGHDADNPETRRRRAGDDADELEISVGHGPGNKVASGRVHFDASQ